MKLVVVFLAVLALTSVIGVGPAEAATHPVPGGTFVDDDGNLHEPSIEAIFAAGITVGCVPGSYCPAARVSRAEMAVFLLRAVHQQPADQYHGYFTDVPVGQWYTAYVERLHELGITSGLGDGRYGPDLPVSRAEMAAFLVRAFNLPAAPMTGSFVDVPAGQWYSPFVEAVHQAGVTSGCTSAPPSFCPDGLVLRDQMASFLTRALGLAPIDVLMRRSLVDRADNTNLPQIHLIYAVPSDGVDTYLDEQGWIAAFAANGRDWFYEASGRTNLRFDTFGQRFEFDVGFVRLPHSSTEIANASNAWWTIANDVYSAGFNQPSDKIYGIFYDGTYGQQCGIASSIERYAITFLGCDSIVLGGYPPIATMLHEILHILGAVQTCAPNADSGHVYDHPGDLMWPVADNFSGYFWLDYGNDDYYGHANPYCFDVADSTFLDPLPLNPKYPPGWS